MKSDHQKLVEAFMAKAGQELPSAPCMPSAEVRLLRAKLILEEALETIFALGCGVSYGGMVRHLPDFQAVLLPHAPDMEEIADGCADLSVVTIGTLSACGIADDPLLAEVDAANLRKFEPPKCSVCGATMYWYEADALWACGTEERMCTNTMPLEAGPHRRADGKWIKPPYFKGPDIARVLKEQVAPAPVAPPIDLFATKQGAKRLWVEDECAPDAERIGQAWQRLFGEPRPAKALQEQDGGDCVAYLYPKGRLAFVGPPKCGWTEIWQLPVSEQ